MTKSLTVLLCALLLAGCRTNQDYAMDQAFALCGMPGPELSDQERQRRHDCYAQAYPQFLGMAQMQTQAAMQNIQNTFPKPVTTNCYRGYGGSMHCSTY
jgi:hypothetical protein